MNEKIKTSNVITLFVVVHLAVLVMAWIAFKFVVKMYPEQMLGRGEYLQLVPIDAAMLAQVQAVRAKKDAPCCMPWY